MLSSTLRALRPLATRPSRLFAMSAPSGNPGPVEASIRAKLETQLSPNELTITNDSWQHRSHAAMKAQGGGSGETHFSVQVVSDAFTGKTTLQRHRMIYTALSDEIDNQGVHALSLKTKTVAESIAT